MRNHKDPTPPRALVVVAKFVHARTENENVTALRAANRCNNHLAKRPLRCGRVRAQANNPRRAKEENMRKIKQFTRKRRTRNKRARQGNKTKQKKVNKVMQDIGQFALKSGYTEQELNMLVDHRALITLYQAAKYDQLLQKKGLQDKKVKTNTRMISSEAKNQTQSTDKKIRVNDRCRV